MPSTPLECAEKDIVGKGLTMETKATLYRDGTLTLQNRSRSINFGQGLQGHSLFAIIIGENGKAIGMSKLFYPPTVGAYVPGLAACDKRQTFTDRVPEEVAMAAVSIDLVQNEGPLRDHWEQAKQNILRGLRDAKEISDAFREAALEDIIRL